MKKLTSLWKDLSKHYNQKRKPIYFDFKRVAQCNLCETRSKNYPHYIHYYPGKVFPYIPLFLFSIKELCPPDGQVLDPFCGSGTVLLESILNSQFKRNAYGVEINPLGRLISKVKTVPLKVESVRNMLNQICSYYDNLSNKIDFQIPEFQNKDLWFSEKAIKKLAKLKHSINNLDESNNYKDFFWVCFSSIIRKVARADPFIPPPVLLKPYKYKNSPKYEFLRNFLRNTEDPDIIPIFQGTVENNSRSLNTLNNIGEIIESKIKAEIIWDDAKEISLSKLAELGKVIKNNTIPRLPSKSIDLIVTSPPYLTAQKYIRTNKLELLWLGLTTGKELLELDKTFIGTERVSPKQIDFNKQMGIKSIDRLIKFCMSISTERAALVYKYFQDMQKAIFEMYRVLKNDAYAVLVVGNNTVLKRKVDTYRLLIDLAVLVGFREVLILKDDIKGRGMITKRHNSGGLIKEEYVILLKKESF